MVEISYKYDNDVINKYLLMIREHEAIGNMPKAITLFSKRKYNNNEIRNLCLNIMNDLSYTPVAVISKEIFIKYFYKTLITDYGFFNVKCPQDETIKNGDFICYTLTDTFKNNSIKCINLVSKKKYSENDLDILKREAEINICSPVGEDPIRLIRISQYLISNKGFIGVNILGHVNLISNFKLLESIFSW